MTGMVLASGIACDSSLPLSNCPAPFVANEYRTEAMQDLLSDDSIEQVCYGLHRPSVILPSGMVLMDHSLPIKEGAARLAHFGHHLNLSPVEYGPECVERAIQREAEAFQVELQWRERLEIRHSVWAYEFEAGWREAEEPVQFLENFIQTHPEGAIGLSPLVDDYTKQCANEPP